jgi:uncharacterized cupredoxin-like copper-binding protein
VCSLGAGFASDRAGNELFVRTVATLFVALMFALAGCGGDDGGETTDGTSSQTFSISESDFTLTPSTVTIDAPGTYTFEAMNDGGVDHSLEIEGMGIEEETETIGPGESASMTVDLEAGTYEMYCPIGNHRDLGMSGEITVSG